jgi:hypothetical protein
MIDNDVIFDSVLLKLEGIWPGLAEVEQGQDVERYGETHLNLDTAVGQRDENRQNYDPKVEHIGAHKGQEAEFVDASEGEDVLVVYLRIVDIPEVDLLFFRQENVG